jgi:hypothetical protein
MWYSVITVRPPSGDHICLYIEAALSIGHQCPDVIRCGWSKGDSTSIRFDLTSFRRSLLVFNQ